MIKKRDKKSTAAAILMGGKASRMGGMPKYALTDGQGEAYIRLQMRALKHFDSIYLSAADAVQIKDAMALLDDSDVRRVTGVPDQIKGAGPLGGLCAVLRQSREEWLFVTACDMPRLSGLLPDRLSVWLDEETDCVICQDKTGRIHPLCGFYRRTALPVIEAMLARGHYAVMNLLVQLRCRVVCPGEIGLEDEVLENINMPEDDYRIRQKHRPGIICVCGVKNSGKTTYIEQLVRIWTAGGRRVAVIKHDGHDFEGDRPGTDTYRHQQAGAYGTAVFSETRYMVNKEIRGMDADRLISYFPEADVIIIEGLKNSAYPKIELVREGISEKISCSRKNLLAVVTNLEKDWGDLPVLPLDQPEKFPEFLKNAGYD